MLLADLLNTRHDNGTSVTETWRGWRTCPDVTGMPGHVVPRAPLGGVAAAADGGGWRLHPWQAVLPYRTRGQGRHTG